MNRTLALIGLTLGVWQICKAGVIYDVTSIVEGNEVNITLRKSGDCTVKPIELKKTKATLELENCQIDRSYSFSNRGIVSSIKLEPSGKNTLIHVNFNNPAKTTYLSERNAIKLQFKQEIADIAANSAGVNILRFSNGEKLIVELGKSPTKVSYKKEKGAIKVFLSGVKLETKTINTEGKSSLVKKVSFLPSNTGSIIEFRLGQETKAVEVINNGTQLELSVYKRTEEKGSHDDKKVLLQFTNADVRSVVRAITDVVGVNVVIDPDVKGKVTVNFKKPVYWKEALKAVLRPLNLIYVERENYLEILPQNKLFKQVSLEPVNTYVVRLNYVDATKVVSQLKTVISDAQKRYVKEDIQVDEETNSLIMRVTEKHFREIKRVLSQLDRPTKQILVKAKIVQISSDAEKDLGFSWYISGYNYLGDSIKSSYGAMSYGFNVAKYNQLITPETFMKLSNLPVSDSTLALGVLNPTQTFKVELALKALELEDQANIVSSPKVLTLDNQEASIEQGIEIPYTESTVASGGTTSFNVKFRKASLILKVKPHVTTDGYIVMDLEVRKDSPNYAYVSITGGSEPAIDTRRVKSKVKIKDGDTVVIGGIYEKEKGKSEAGVPVLSKIPLLGWLFRNEVVRSSDKQLIIFITPQVVEEQRRKG